MYKKIFHHGIAFFLLTSIITACDKNEDTDSIQNHLNLSTLYFNQGSYNSSILEAQNALKISPNNTQAIYQIAKILIEIGDLQGTINLLQKHQNKDDRLKLLLAKAQSRSGQPAHAISILMSIKHSDSITKSEFEVETAHILVQQGKYKQALDAYKKVLTTDPASVEANIGLSRLNLQMDDYKNALATIDTALKLAPENIEAQLWKAQLLMLNKSFSDAETLLSRTLILMEQYDILTFNKYSAIDMMAKVLIAQGKIEESFTYSNFLAKSRIGKFNASFKEAYTAFESGKLDSAEASLKKLIEQAPQHTKSHLLLGYINFNQGDYSDADLYLSKFANKENTPIKAQILLIQVKIRLKQFEAANQLIDQSIAKHPDIAAFYALDGYLKLILNKAQQSIVSYNKAIAIEPDNLLYITSQANAYMQLRQFGSANAVIKKAQKLDADNERVFDTRIRYHILQNQYDTARNIALRWHQLNPDNTRALNTLAGLEELNQNPAKAMKYYQMVLKQDNNNLVSNLQLARLAAAAGKSDDVFKYLSKLITNYPDNKQPLSILFAYSIKHRAQDKAIEILEQITKLQPDALFAHYTLGKLYLVSQELHKLQVLLDSILEKNDRYAPAYALKSELNLRQKKIKPAITNAQLATALAPDDASGHLLLATLLFTDKQLDKSEESINKALSIDTDNIRAYTILFKLHLQTKQPEKALSVINTLKEKNASTVLVSTLLTDYYLNLQNFNEAATEYKKVWQANKNLTNTRRLSGILQKLNKNDEAFKVWDLAAPDNAQHLAFQISHTAVLSEQKAYDRATRLLQKLIRQYPDNAVLLNNLANVYLSTENSKALETAKQALRLAPDNPFIMDTVGWIYAQQHKDYSSALPLLQAAYDKTGNSEISNHLEAVKRNIRNSPQ